MIKVAKEGHDISVDIQIYANMPAKAQGIPKWFLFLSALLLATYPYHENLGKQLSIVAGKVNIDKKSLQKGNSSMASKPNNAMRIPKVAAKKTEISAKSAKIRKGKKEGVC